MGFVQHVQAIHRPRNDRSVDVAQRRITQITALAQREQANAIQVGGMPCLIYQRLTQGTTCSCSVALDASPTAPMFDEHGNASDTHIASLLTGGRFGISKYGSSSNRGADSTVEPVRLIDGQKQAEVSGPALDPNVNVVEVDASNTIELDMDSYEAGNCSICFGTGIVGGYRLRGGHRIIIDSQRTGVVLSRVTKDQLQTPHVFEFLDDSARLTFNATLPLNATIQCVRAFNNQHAVPAHVEVLNGSWAPFNTTSNALCDGVSHTFQVYPYAGNSFITHVEIQLLQSNLIKLDFPPLNRTGDQTYLDATQDVTVLLPPTVQNLQPGDLIADARGFVWRIRDMTYKRDNLQRQLCDEANCRIVQKFERLHHVFHVDPLHLPQLQTRPLAMPGAGNNLQIR